MIHLGGKYYAAPYEYGWKLQVATVPDKNGDMQYRPIGYYSELGDALEKYITICIADRISSGAFELKEGLEIIREERAKMHELLERCLEEQK